MHSCTLSSGNTSNQNHIQPGKTPEDTWTIYTSTDAPQKKLQKELTAPLYQALQKAYRSNLTPEALQHNDAITY
jgi:hypothetical protein